MKGTVAVIGSGPAGLVAAWALQNDGYQVTIFEKHDHLTLARHAENVAPGKRPVDIPMRTFSGSYYANLFQLLGHLQVKTRIHRFRYQFHQGQTQYFQFFSNFHRIAPCLQNPLWMNLYLLACYLWYTVAVFLLPPRIRDRDSVQLETETLGEYARRIRLPNVFLDWYLLPLFASVATCSHADLRACPAAYIANYRKRTFGAHHRTVADMQALQDRLTVGVSQRLRTAVLNVCSTGGVVEVRSREVDHPTVQTEAFNHVILATNAKQAGLLFPPVGTVTSQLNEGRVLVTVQESSKGCDTGSSEILDLVTAYDDTLGPVTDSIHSHPSGMRVTVAPYVDGKAGQIPNDVQTIYLQRPLPTATSHNLLLSVLGGVPVGGATWKNGQDGVYLVGGYASAGLPLLEACVRSALEAAVGIGATLPFDMVRNTPF